MRKLQVGEGGRERSTIQPGRMDLPWTSRAPAASRRVPGADLPCTWRWTWRVPAPGPRSAARPARRPGAGPGGVNSGAGLRPRRPGTSQVNGRYTAGTRHVVKGRRPAREIRCDKIHASRREFRRPRICLPWRVKKGPGNRISLVSAQKAAARGTSRHDTHLHPPAAAGERPVPRGRDPRRPAGRPWRAPEHLARPARAGLRPARQPCGGPVTAAAAARVIDVVLPARRPGRRRRRLAAAARPRLPPAARPDRGRPRPAPPGRARRPAAAARRPRRRDGRPGHHRLLRPGAGHARTAAPGCCTPPASGCCGPAASWPSSPPAAPAATAAGDRPGSVVAAARAAGLVYAQHIVLVHAAIDGDRLAPAEPRRPAPPARPAAARVHCDLLVFTKPGGARP